MLSGKILNFYLYIILLCEIKFGGRAEKPKRSKQMRPKGYDKIFYSIYPKMPFPIIPEEPKRVILCYKRVDVKVYNKLCLRGF